MDTLKIDDLDASGRSLASHTNGSQSPRKSTLRSPIRSTSRHSHHSTTYRQTARYDSSVEDVGGYARLSEHNRELRRSVHLVRETLNLTSAKLVAHIVNSMAVGDRMIGPVLTAVERLKSPALPRSNSAPSTPLPTLKKHSCINKSSIMKDVGRGAVNQLDNIAKSYQTTKFSDGGNKSTHFKEHSRVRYETGGGMSSDAFRSSSSSKARLTSGNNVPRVHVNQWDSYNESTVGDERRTNSYSSVTETVYERPVVGAAGYTDHAHNTVSPESSVVTSHSHTRVSVTSPLGDRYETYNSDAIKSVSQYSNNSELRTSRTRRQYSSAKSSSDRRSNWSYNLERVKTSPIVRFPAEDRHLIDRAIDDVLLATVTVEQAYRMACQLRPMSRMIGEVCYQLDCRIIDEVFAPEPDIPLYKRRAFYGSPPKLITSKIRYECHSLDGNADVKKELSMRYRFNAVVQKLSVWGYMLEYHSDFSQTMIATYKIVQSKKDRKLLSDYAMLDPRVLRCLVYRIVPDPQKLKHILILFDCLCILAFADKTPIFRW